MSSSRCTTTGRGAQRLELGQDKPHTGLGVAEYIIEDPDPQPLLNQLPHTKISRRGLESCLRPSALRPRAREEARKLKGSVAHGADPVATKRQAKAAEVAKGLRTIKGLADAYLADAALGLHREAVRWSGPGVERSIERRVHGSFPPRA